ncbi:tubby-like F-box protein 5 [Iris pallida]|uniref:Tubby-like F-box protein 5 n=1 Tax=Iris pallida TaxID=29817 RepID=A0AAX6HD99_IRIPA|nr:tubby-like F-box protein 5 [Iris pallida]KAJ6838647.1 tubby-like F-box protein 5 [Iris pallida]KAJ6838648.1 tubby-like F-box protein 5 [Iris pallida]
MSFKSIVRELREMRDGLGSMSRSGAGGGRSLSPCREDEGAVAEEGEEQGRWANLPPELLLDIIERVEASEAAWPARRSVVACASVCRRWREVTKEIVETPEQCGRITFPISLKQPGPRDSPIQCFIRRERATGTYKLYLGLSPSLHGENDKLLLTARKIRRAMSTDFVVSLSSSDFSRSSSTYIGKLRQVKLSRDEVHRL